MEKLLKFIITGIVEHPDEVKIVTETKEGVNLLHLRVAPDDIAKVIGKKGRIINAVRQLVKTACIIRQQKAIVLLEE